MTAYLFDLYGVLLKVQEEGALRDIERAVGAGPEIWETYWEFRYDLDAGLITEQEYWEKFRQALNLPPFDVDAVIDVDYSGWVVPDEEMIAYVTGLVEQGERVGLLSNIPRGLAERVLKEHTWLDRFAAVTLSCDLGVAKPQQGAFQAALQNLGSTPEDTVFFDDNPDNVAAARALGITGVVFRNIDDVKDEVERNS
mgnify:FL=1